MAQIPIKVITDRAALNQTIQAIRAINETIDNVRANLVRLGREVARGVSSAKAAAAKATSGPERSRALTGIESERQRVISDQTRLDVERLRSIKNIGLKKKAFLNSITRDIEAKTTASIKRIDARRAAAAKSEITRQKALSSTIARISGTRISAVPGVQSLIVGRLGPDLTKSLKEMDRIGDFSKSISGMKNLSREADVLLEQLPRIQRSFKLDDKTISGMRQTLTTFQGLRKIGNQNVGFFTKMREQTVGFVRQVEKYAVFQIRWFASAAILFAIPAAIGAAIRSIVKFDQALATIKGVTGASAAEMRLLAFASREVALTTPVAATAAAEMGLKLVQAGLSARAAAKAMQVVAKVSTLSSEDMTAVAGAMTTAMFAWRISANESERIGNVLAATLNFSRLQIADIGIAFNFLASVSATFDQSLEDTSAAIAVLSNRGLKASTIGTGLSTMLVRLASPTKKFRQEMDRLGVNMEDVNPKTNKLSQIVRTLSEAGFDASRSMELMNLRGGRTMAASMNAGAAAIERMEKRIANSKQLSDGFDESMKGVGNQLKLMKNVIEALALAFGVVLIPAMKTFSHIIGFLGRNVIAVSRTFGHWGIVVIPILVLALNALRRSITGVAVATTKLQKLFLVLTVLELGGLIHRFLFGDLEINKITRGLARVQAGSDDMFKGIAKTATAEVGSIADVFEDLRIKIADSLGKVPVELPRVVTLLTKDDILGQMQDILKERNRLLQEVKELGHNFDFQDLLPSVQEGVLEDITSNINALVDSYKVLGNQLASALEEVLKPESQERLVSDLIQKTFRSADRDIKFHTDRIRQAWFDLKLALEVGDADGAKKISKIISKETLAISGKIRDMESGYKKVLTVLADPTPIQKIKDTFSDLRKAVDFLMDNETARKAQDITISQLKEQLRLLRLIEQRKIAILQIQPKLPSRINLPTREGVTTSLSEKNERLTAIFDQQIGTVIVLSEAYNTLSEAFLGNSDALKTRNAQMEVGIFLQQVFAGAVASTILGEQKASVAIKRAAAQYIAALAAQAAIHSLFQIALGLGNLALAAMGHPTAAAAANLNFTSAAKSGAIAGIAGAAARGLNPGRSGDVGSPGNPAVTQGLGSNSSTQQSQPIQVNLTIYADDTERINFDRVIGDLSDALGEHLGRGGTLGPIDVTVLERN